MSSRDGRIDGDRELSAQDGLAREAFGGAVSSPFTNGRANGALTLDEAEGIAARRLQEFAIRLGDGAGGDETQDDAPEPPFDADRHFRARLAKRIAALHDEPSAPDADDGQDELLVQDEADRSSGPPYAVTDALDLSAFGERFAAWAKPVYRVEPLLHFQEEMPDRTEHHEPTGVLATENDETYVMHPVPTEHVGEDREPSMRLVDLINEQRTLLNRLADLSLSRDQETAPADKPDDTASALPVNPENPDNETAARAPVGDGEDAAPAAISAAQLIAALGTPAAPLTIAEAKPALAVLSSLRRIVPDEEPRPPLNIVPFLHEPAQERPPMIIQRARAELSAVERGQITHEIARPSGAVGFIAGLSLSMVIGAVLYMVLQT